MRASRNAAAALAILAVVALAPLAAHAQNRRQSSCLGDGFKEARWGMNYEELKKVVPGLREDFNRFEPRVTTYHSFEFPNNGFSEFRLFDGQLFYIRVKITSPEFNDQLRQSMLRCGKPASADQTSSAQRYLWSDDTTAKALYLYPYYAEIRAKSEKLGKEWAALKEEESRVEEFLDSRMLNAAGAQEESEDSGESSDDVDAQLRELEKALEAERANTLVADPNE